MVFPRFFHEKVCLDGLVSCQDVGLSYRGAPAKLSPFGVSRPGERDSVTMPEKITGVGLQIDVK